MSRRPVGRRVSWIAGLLLTLVIAGVVSYYASSHPDGLEWAAGESGFADTARDSAAADSPLADYGVAGVDDGRLSGGLAGVIGVAVTLVLAGGLTLLLRRRTGTAPGAQD
jgi:cobalt/nickel transport protein